MLVTSSLHKFRLFAFVPGIVGEAETDPVGYRRMVVEHENVI